MMCGYRSYSAIAQWGRNYGRFLACALGFTHKRTPCAATFFNVLSGIDVTELEIAENQWANEIRDVIATEEQPLEGISIDGKTLQGSQKQGADFSHLLSVVSHRLGLTLFQQAVSESRVI